MYRKELASTYKAVILTPRFSLTYVVEAFTIGFYFELVNNKNPNI
jgi:type III secretory pathway component EscR